MSTLITSQARAYVNHSRWIADCPMDCGAALALGPKESVFHCPECHHITTIEWPPNADEIIEALLKRPIPKTRNWFPSGHTLAVRAGVPHGQSVAELDDETHDHMG